MIPIQPNTLPRTLQKGWLARSRKARDKILKARDPERLLAARVRTMTADVAAAATFAQAEWDETHKPMPTPLPAYVHRDVAARIAAFLHDSGLADRDLTKPIEPHESIADIEQRHRVRLQRECDEAVRELAEMERERALERIRAAEAGLERVDAQHEAYGIEPPVASGSDGGAETVEAADAPRRRGRPPKVILDPAADVVPH